MAEAKKTRTKHSSGYNHRQHRRRSRLLGFILLILIGGAGYTVFSVIKVHNNANQKADDASKAIRQVIDGDGAKVTLTKVESKLGFSLQYDKTLVSLKATLSDKSTISEEKIGVGNYVIVEGVPVASKTNTASGSSIEIRTSADKNFVAAQRKQFGQDLSEEKVTEKYFDSLASSGAKLDLVSASNEVAGGTSYTKRAFQFSDDTLARVKRLVIVYTTVQNGRPYGVILRQSSAATDAQLAGFSQIINSLRYSPPASGSILGIVPRGTISLAAVETPTGLVNTPSQLGGDTALKIVAKRQPAVVRIGTIACGSLEISGPNGASIPQIPVACAIEAGSGSIVSKDGYVSTNGHVVKATTPAIYETYLILTLTAGDAQPFRAYLNYLVKSKLMSEVEINSCLEEIKAQHEECFDKLLFGVEEIAKEDFKLTNLNESFAVQLSDAPIKPKLEGPKASFVFDDTIVQAKLIDFDFDSGNSKGGRQMISESSTSDVAILKMEGKDFPIVPLGTIDSLGPRSELTAVGWPGFVDGALQTTQARTIPSATQGPVTEIVTDSDLSNRKLVVANLPIAQGNSGGPAFNDKGEEVGLTTYSGDTGDPESGKTKFSKVGILRDVADYKLLLSKNNLTLTTDSKITQVWDEGIDKFSIAHYKEALTRFEQIKKDYKQNYLAEQFIKVSNDKIAAGEDLSGDKAIKTLLILLGVFGVSMTIVVMALLHHFKHGRRMLAQTHMPVGANLPTDMGAFMPTQTMVTQPVQAYSPPQSAGAYAPPAPIAPAPAPAPPVVPAPAAPVVPPAQMGGAPPAAAGQTFAPQQPQQVPPNQQPPQPPLVQ